LAQSHGGRMWVDSQPGQGSTFSVLFPLSQSSATSDEAGEQLPGRNGQNEQ
jgi:signal transduction histidine kinase